MDLYRFDLSHETDRNTDPCFYYKRCLRLHRYHTHNLKTINFEDTKTSIYNLKIKVLTSTSEEAVFFQFVSAISALRAASRYDRRFTNALTTFYVTNSNSAKNTCSVTLTFFTTVRIVGVEVPKQRLALIADSAFNSIFALAELTCGDRSTTREAIDYTSRVAVAVYQQKQ